MQKPLPLIVLTSALLAAAPALAESEHHHRGHDAQGLTGLTLDHGRKWATDDPLRTSMASLRDTFAARIPAIHGGTLDAAGYTALADAVDTEVAHIIARCKLTPAADAMFHLVLAEMTAGTAILRGKAPGKPAQGAHRVAMALNAYGEHFEHPGWQPLK